MKKLITIPLLLLLYTAASSQVCGGGVFTIQFYVLGGTNEDISYEITPVSLAEFDSLLNHSNYDTITRRHLKGNVHNAIILDPAFIDVETFLRKRPAAGTRIEAFGEEKVIEILRQTARHFKIPFAIRDRAKKGIIEFPTAETYSRYFILRFTAGNTTGYLYGNFFGGCHKTVKLYRAPESAFRKFE